MFYYTLITLITGFLTTQERLHQSVQGMCSSPAGGAKATPCSRAMTPSSPAAAPSSTTAPTPTRLKTASLLMSLESHVV